MEPKRPGPATALGLTILTIATDLIAAVRLDPHTRVPLHFGLSGQPDRFGSPMGAGLTWIVMLVVFWIVMMAMRTALSRRPHTQTGPRTLTAFDTAWLGLTAVMIVVDAVTFARAPGRVVDMPSVMTFLFGGLAILLGNLFGTLSPNPFIGIRLPWTMRDRDVWDRTHRTAGRIFILAGVCQIAFGLSVLSLPPRWHALWGAGGASLFLVCASLASAIISWRYAKEMET